MHGLLYQQLLSHQYRGVSAAHISNFCTLQSLANKRGLCVKPYNHTKFQDSVLNLAFFRITVSQDYRIPCRLAVFRSLRAAGLAGRQAGRQRVYLLQSTTLGDTLRQV